MNWTESKHLDKTVKNLYWVVVENDTGTKIVQYQTQAMWIPKMSTLNEDADCHEDAEYDEVNDEFYTPEGWYEYMYEADFYYPIESSTCRVTHFMERHPMPSIYHIGLMSGVFGTMKNPKHIRKADHFIKVPEIFDLVKSKSAWYRKIKRYMEHHDGLQLYKGKYPVTDPNDDEIQTMKVINDLFARNGMFRPFSISNKTK